MNAFELADLAAMVSLHGQQLVDAEPRAVEQSLAAYWKASRCRLDRWGRALRSLRTTSEQQNWSPAATSLLEEILVSEILSRSVAAIAAGHDQHHKTAEFAPIGRNLLAAQLDTRRRGLAIVKTPGFVETDEAQSILALGRQTDRWSDVMLAYLSPHVDVAEFAVSPGRVQDFAYDARQHIESTTSTNMATTMVLSGLRTSLRNRGGKSAGKSPNADLNLDIATAVVAWFEPTMFDSFGLLRSQWQARLRSVPNESLAQLDEWWQPPPVVAAPSHTSRWRR